MIDVHYQQKSKFWRDLKWLIKLEIGYLFKFLLVFIQFDEDFINIGIIIEVASIMIYISY